MHPTFCRSVHPTPHTSRMAWTAKILRPPAHSNATPRRRPLAAKLPLVPPTAASKTSRKSRHEQQQQQHDAPTTLHERIPQGDPMPFARLCLLPWGFQSRPGRVFDRPRSRAESVLGATDWLESGRCRRCGMGETNFSLSVWRTGNGHGRRIIARGDVIGRQCHGDLALPPP